MRGRIAGTEECLPGQDVPERVVTNDEIIGMLLARQAIKPGVHTDAAGPLVSP